MALDLNKMRKQLKEALEAETKESLTKWIEEQKAKENKGMNKIQKIQERVERLQKDNHDFHRLLIKENPLLDTNSTTNIWLYVKLAELELQVEELNRKIKIVIP